MKIMCLTLIYQYLFNNKNVAYLSNSRISKLSPTVKFQIAIIH